MSQKKTGKDTRCEKRSRKEKLGIKGVKKITRFSVSKIEQQFQRKNSKKVF